jgi:hypothetical protein
VLQNLLSKHMLEGLLQRAVATQNQAAGEELARLGAEFCCSVLKFPFTRITDTSVKARISALPS